MLVDFFFQAEDGIRDYKVTGVQTCALPISLGQAPMKYLSDWRMTLARDLLLIQDTTLAEIADRVGYSSVYAFATAFRRHHGESPGRWRQREALGMLAAV